MPDDKTKVSEPDRSRVAANQDYEVGYRASKYSGASKYAGEKKNKRNLARSKAKEARGKTGQQEREGKSHVGARDRRESSRAMGGKNAKATTARGRKAARSRSRDGGPTKSELYARAKRRGIGGRSKMSKRQLENALGI